MAQDLRRLEAGLTPDRAAALRAALLDAGYTYDRVADLLGPLAHAALLRNETVPARRATADGSPLATLVRLWLLQLPVPAERLEAALPGWSAALADLGLVARADGLVRATVDVRPYADEDHAWWVVSDLTPGLDGPQPPVPSDHVLGVSSASSSLAQLTVRGPVRRALDLGTGCGVQALHLAGHAERVVATDVNRRALRLAALTAALNGVEDRVELREGSLYEPVAGERFDLVVSNPPFVISPARGERLVYRDSGLPGDEVVERVVRQAPAHLTEGGTCQVLANWSVVAGSPWEERLTGWLAGSGCDAWVVQRERLDPAEYVELWLKDAGVHGAPDYPERYDAWLGWFEEVGVQAVGFGWLHLRRTDAARPELRLEEWPYEVEQPVAPEVDAWFGRVASLRRLDDPALLGSRLVTRSDVRQETYGAPGAADPEQIVLRQQRGLRRARSTDTVEAALVGACDGELTVGQVLDALATLLEQEPDRLRAEYLPRVRELVAEGFLTT
jgi:hypothetical protein